MVIRGVSTEQAEQVAENLGISFRGSDTSGPRKGVETSGVLRPLGVTNPYQRVSASAFNEKPRRVWAVCWHGHRDFMRGVFKLNPDARIRSAFADYQGAGDFEASYRDTGWRNVGSMAYPRRACEVCRCAESGTAE